MHTKSAIVDTDAMERTWRDEVTALKAQVSHYETALESVPHGVCIFDNEQRIVLCNRQFAAMNGLKPEHIRPGTTLGEFDAFRNDAGTDSTVAGDHAQCLAAIQRSEAPHVWLSDLQDGRTIRVSCRPTPDGGFVVTHEDTSERQTALRVANESVSLQTLVDWVPDYLWVKDRDSRFAFANKALALDSGRSEARELIGLSDFDLHSEELAQQFHELEQEILRSGNPMIDREECVVDASGTMKWLSSTKVPLRNDQNEIVGIFGIARDVSARKELELKVRESLLLLNTTLDNFPGGICMHDQNLVLTVANKGYYEINNIDENWFPIGSKLEDILHYLTGRGSFGPIDDVDSYVAERVTELRSTSASESQITRQDGATIALRHMPLEDGGFVMTFEDVTESINAEKERTLLQRELVQAQKLESLGTLASGVAHEINTPVQYIGDNIRFIAQCVRDLLRILQLCRKSLREPIDPGLIAAQADILLELESELDLDFILEELPLALEQSAHGVVQVATIVRAIKEFSHPGQDQKIEFDLNAIIETTLIVSKNQWKYFAEVETDLDRSMTPIKCLPGELSQTFLNLIVNAAHAIETAKPDRGLIRISTRRDNNMAVITIEDNGCGIPEAIRDRIYDPFFTTKDIGKGTGQGLTIVFGTVVNKHGGTIDCVSHVGEGTTFIISLPIDGADSSNGAANLGEDIEPSKSADPSSDVEMREG